MLELRDDESVPLELNTSVRLPAVLARRVERFAEAERRTRSQMIRILIEEALDAREERP